MAMPARGLTSRAAQAEQTRQQILDTAQRLFSELGYSATSLQMIADELGLTKAAVYYHFRAKNDILHAALQPGIERLNTLLDEAGAMRGRRARTEHLVHGFVDFLVANRQNMVMASTDPDRPEHRDKTEVSALHERGLGLLFGEHPSGAERLAYNAVFTLPDCLAELTDLTDQELREALASTLLRILRVPPARA
ncbi:putative TetR family transcriptional regulator [Actinacidiphila reveromycinica]|uniref:Putative TetR family transcriptional regulator n=1 Tax=Actinacidiphila reveromycinica TaxID=659352 RepID=A0A7U3VNM8_9ACTN|nr:TetR family transcriptional regulator [Streptomyces sp. SN-593]BBA97729.1 putative TetR family transcriptional regulator [Streptomyces sp. SN-593]